MLRTRLRLLCVVLSVLSTFWLTEPAQAQSKNPPKLAHAADEEPLAAIIWNGLGEANPGSTNRTQKLLAEESLREFVKELSAQIDGLFAQAIDRVSREDGKWVSKAAPLLSKSVLIHPSAIMLNQIGANPDELRLALVVDAGKDIDVLRETLDQLVELASKSESDDARVDALQIGGGKFYRVAAGKDRPLIHFGTLGSRMIVAWGDNTFEPLVARLQKPQTPRWVEKQLADLPVDQPNLLTFVDVKKIVATVEKSGAWPHFDMIAKTFGIDGVNHVTLVGGFDAVGMHVNTLISLEGEPRGLLAMSPNKPLKLEAFRRVPANASSATVVRFDLDHALNNILNMASAMAPAAKQDAEAGLQHVEQQLGFSIQKDLCQGLGDEWMLYSSSNAGGAMFVPAFVLSGSVRDQSKVQKVLDVAAKLLLVASQSFGPQSPFTVHEYTIKGNKAVRIQINNIPFAVTPAWVLTKDEFAFSLLPQLLSSHLSQAGKPSLADSEALKEGFKRTPNPFLVGYSDPKPRLGSLYSLINTFAPMAAADTARFGFEFQPPPLPPLSDIEPHLLPSVTTFHFSKDGLRSETHGVVPSGIEVGPASAGILLGLFLPAVESAREAARRSNSKNNMKLIGLAMHNFEETYGRLPGPAIRDKKGKSLLSWRVQILPYIDQQTLYEQFHLDEPWDSEHNKTLIEKMPSVFVSPNHADLAQQGKTTYLAPRGKGTMWDDPEGSRFRDIIDGTSNTIMVVEGPGDAAVIWTKPDDLPIDSKNPWKNLKSVRPGGFQALFVDGSVRFLNDWIDLETLTGLFTRAGEEELGDF